MGEFSGIQAIWIREFKIFQRERSRVISSLFTPLLWIFVFGGGLGNTVSLRAAELQGTNYQVFIFPGIVLQSVLFTTLFYGLYIVWDRKLDFLKEVLVAPVSRSSIFIGKVLGGCTDVLIQATVLLVLARVALGIDVTPIGFVACLLIVFVVAIGTVSIGLTLGSFFESFEGFQVVVSFIAFPMFFLSGGLFPVDDLPPALALGVALNPLTYGVDALRQVLIGHAAFPLVYDLAVISGFALVMMAVGTWAFSRMKI
ncbi:MAG: ABC transporter permease [Euryarchaeota archaeon]|nr:ABC transporter permease [Euryarchaeota archaeon]